MVQVGHWGLLWTRCLTPCSEGVSADGTCFINKSD